MSRHRKRGALHAIGVGLSAGFLGLMALLAVLVVVLPLSVGGSPLTVLTSSMEPKLPPGTLVVVRPAAIDDIRVGEVVTYQLRSGEPELVTHRVVERIVDTDGATTLVTKGDNNAAPDPAPVRAVQIRGTVWYAIPYLGWVNTWLTGDTRAIIVPILAALLFGYALWMVIGSIRERRRRARAHRGRQGPEHAFASAREASPVG